MAWSWSTVSYICVWCYTRATLFQSLLVQADSCVSDVPYNIRLFALACWSNESYQSHTYVQLVGILKNDIPEDQMLTGFLLQALQWEMPPLWNHLKTWCACLITAVPVVVSLFMKVYRVLSTYQIITIEKDSPKPSLVLCSTLNITYHFPEKFEALFIQVSETSILPSAPHSETHEKQTKSQPEMIHYTLPHSPNVVLLALDLFSSAFRYSAIEHILGPIYGASRYLPAFHWRYRSSNMSHLSENES